MLIDVEIGLDGTGESGRVALIPGGSLTILIANTQRNIGRTEFNGLIGEIEREGALGRIDR